jgi:hypothetical protein
MSKSNTQPNSSNKKTETVNFNINDIKKYYKDQALPNPNKLKNGKFTDDYFIPDIHSLMGLDPKTEKPLDQKQYDEDSPHIPTDKITWKRATDIFPYCKLFVDKIEAGDIMQGSLGNCYFLSAIAALTEFPNLIHKIFKTDKISDSGLYEIALFIDGEWQIVIIDDYIPYDAEQDNAAFTQANGQEIWVLMIEKAWAKVNGGYLNTIGGLSSDPLLAFTGFHTRKVDTSINTDELWKTLQDADDNNYIMCVDSKANEEGKLVNLVASHAYTLIGTQEEKYNGKLIRLCQIRNPWGNKEWNGDWSDKSPLWNDYLKEKFEFKTFKEDDWNDGIFFISIEDLQRFFSVVHICAYMYGSKTRTLEIRKENFDTPSIFGLYLDQEVNCSISTHGQCWRYNRHLKNKDIPINITLAKTDENNLNELIYFDSHYSGSEDPFIIRKIPKGYYIISVFYGPDDSDKRYLNDFNLKISANSNFKVDFLTYDKDLNILNKIIKNGILKKKSEEINSKDLFMCFETDLDSSGFGYICISNKSKKTHIKSSLNWSEMLGYKMLPPLKNTKETNLFCSPGEQKIILGFRTRDSGEFWFKIDEKTAGKSKPYPDNPDEKDQKSETDFEKYFQKVYNDNVLKDYYQFVAPELNDAKNPPNFPSINIYEISMVNLSNKYPEQMKKVLKLENKLDITKYQKKYLWKKILASNGYYLSEYLDKEGILGRAIFTFDDNSYFIGIYAKNVREGYFEEYSAKDRLVFKGNYSKGKRNGQGTAYFEDGSYYEGNFTDNVKVGIGKYFFPKGCYYIGEFKNNLINGKGKYYFKENEYWEGNFVDNQKQGEGIYYFASGKSKPVTFKDNKLVK